MDPSSKPAVAAGIAAVAVTAVGYTYWYELSESLSRMRTAVTGYKAPVKVEELFIYPIKTLPGVSVTAATFDTFGFELDRHWSLIDKNNRFISLREKPKLAVLNVQLKEDKSVVVSSPEGKSITVPFLATTGDDITFTVWDDVVKGLEVSAACSTWFSDFLGVPVKLVAQHPAVYERALPEEFNPSPKDQNIQVSLADGFPFLMVSQASLYKLNSRLSKKLTMANFRPNIVISGCYAFDEDNFKNLKIGTNDFAMVKPCERCSIPHIDMNTGKKDPKGEPTKTLRKLHPGKDGAVLFGVNLVQLKSSGTVKVGDLITLTN